MLTFEDFFLVVVRHLDRRCMPFFLSPRRLCNIKASGHLIIMTLAESTVVSWITPRHLFWLHEWRALQFEHPGKILTATCAQANLHANQYLHQGTQYLDVHKAKEDNAILH